MSIQYKEFHTTDSADTWIQENQHHFPSDADEDKLFLQALDYYTASGNPIFNDHLRQHKTIEKDNYFYPYIVQMTKKLPTYQIPDNIVVYRYINKGLLKAMCDSYPPKRGSILQDKGFMSTTLIRSSIANLKIEKRLNVLLVISLPQGTKGTYIGLLPDSLPEYEILLAPNTKLHVDDKLPFCNNCFWCTAISEIQS